MGAQVVEQCLDDPIDLRVLARSLRAEVAAREHEVAQRGHRRPDARALHDVPRALGGLDEVVHERVDPPWSRVAQHRDRLRRQVAERDDSRANGVVDVVIDVRDAVDEADDPSLEGRRRLRAPGVTGDTVAGGRGEVEAPAGPREAGARAQRVLVVAESRSEPPLETAIEGVLADVPERRVAEVVAEPDRLGEVLVEPEGSRDRPRDLRDLERVGQPRAVVIADG